MLEQKQKQSKSEVKSQLNQEYFSQSKDDCSKRFNARENNRRIENTSLDLHHLYNMEKHKANVFKKSEIISKNLENYLKYKEVNSSDIIDKVAQYQNACFNSATGSIIPQYSLNHIRANHQAHSSLNQNFQQSEYSIQKEILNVPEQEQPNLINPLESIDNTESTRLKSKAMKKLEKVEDGQPTFYRYYAFNPNKNYNIKETVSTIKRNVVSPSNFKDLESILQLSKNETLKTSKSVLDFNLQQVTEKKKKTQLEKLNKLAVMQSNLKYIDSTNREIQEKVKIKKQGQNDYYHILDAQTNPKINKKIVNDKFKFYSDYRGFDLGEGLAKPNPITNPVNSYVFKSSK